MSALRKIGTFPTPYGISVDVFDANDPRDPEAFVFSPDSAALTGGIHSTEQRAAFVRRCEEIGGVNLAIMKDFGGGPPPRINLKPPKRPIYPSLPQGNDMDIPTEAFVTMLMDRHRWCDRVGALLPAVEGNLIQAEGWEASAFPMPKVMGLAMGLLVTAALEHLHETEIDCIEAAAVYALSEHKQWSASGVEWLTPFKDTWARDWIETRPAYRRWAAARISEGSKLPAWLAGGMVQ
jgi:hypothetical protein